MKREDVVRILGEHRQELRVAGVRTLSLFGSTARDEADSESDVDLLVEFDHPVGLFAYGRLQELLEAWLGRKVDLGDPDWLRPAIREDVLREALRVA